MGKLVLGILFVILLQVVFFAYTSRYWSAPNGLDLARVRPDPSYSHPAVVPPTVIPPTSEIAEPRPSTVEKKPEGESYTRLRARSRAVSAYRVPKIIRSDREPAVIDSAPRRIIRPRNEQLATVIPPGHTMVLVDKLGPQPSSRQATEIPVPKKRSLFAKSFSVVVKKPWGWVKSLASKLN